MYDPLLCSHYIQPMSDHAGPAHEALKHAQAPCFPGTEQQAAHNNNSAVPVCNGLDASFLDDEDTFEQLMGITAADMDSITDQNLCFDSLMESGCLDMGSLAADMDMVPAIPAAPAQPVLEQQLSELHRSESAHQLASPPPGLRRSASFAVNNTVQQQVRAAFIR